MEKKHQSELDRKKGIIMSRKSQSRENKRTKITLNLKQNFKSNVVDTDHDNSLRAES